MRKRATDQRFLLAVDEGGGGWILFFHGEAAALEVDAGGRVVQDVFWNVPAPGAGLWVWEGEISYVDDGDGADAEFEGSFRRPSAIELIALARGRQPWLPPLACPRPAQASFGGEF